MPRESACRNCAEKKVGCKPSLAPGTQACQRCVERNLLCERPRNTTVHADSERRKTSCDECRTRRVKCERQDVDAKSCFHCSTKGYACNLDPQSGFIAQTRTTTDDQLTVPAASCPTSSGPVDISAPSEIQQGDFAGGNNSKDYWSVVLIPSS
ncbi:hypothetical protein C8Q73DRAFT_685569 [Cubamyces lactineus]|nr:hypothetical protein C8Q73DRAFT_685569 [Cubamyces lactineus]